MILILTHIASAEPTDGVLILPSWPIQSALPWLFLAIFVLLFSLRFSIFRKNPNWMQPLIWISAILGLVSLLSGIAQQWFLLALVVGVGFSLRHLVQDSYAFLLLMIEQRVIFDAWVEGEGYAGRVQNRSWRCVTLKDGREQTMLVPNRFFLSHTIKITPPGLFSTKLRCWIPEGLTLLEVEARVIAWIPTAPWVAEFYGLYPDDHNPQLMIIELSLLRADDKNKVLRALRAIMEKQQ